ncbi:RNA-directed DNA polymerase, eukaryota [Tanacetum coccineum]|uniref:RNA-directed DNA polymerase, eukaryota n=1 Tax=Tanacetum coccineum TaxID=301880 RepID=A0ABQ4XGA0_9ASTR
MLKNWKNNLLSSQTQQTTSLRFKLQSIDTLAETSTLSSTDIESRSKIIKDLHDIEYCHLTDLRQKAKTRWALEGDENSGFFHGIINSNRNRSRINGLNIHGSWTRDPTALKSHIFQVYSSKFKEDVISRPTFSSDNFKKLSSDDLLILDYPISDQEIKDYVARGRVQKQKRGRGRGRGNANVPKYKIRIKDAVWDCGSEKAPGPDGFTFKFYKSQWDTIAPDVIAYIREFEMTSFLPRGCNSSFIALVPKVEDPLVINDFRPISLIGSQYKILAKILANRLAMVIPSVVSEAQTAFIKGRQIIDGPLMVDEIISWAKVYKKKLFMLKVDFEKAFDTLSWSFLDSIMAQMGFTSKWRQWIFACLNSGYASVLVNGFPTLEFKIERGLRQGDPLSPLLFILAIEALNVVIIEAKNRSLFRGVEVGKDRINVSHFQFADDALILGEWSFLNAPKSIINKLESIRRNFFWGGSLDSQKISWIAWKKVISPLKCGGLGIDSLSSSNISLLSKWWWRFYNESDSLWGRVIRSIHGPQGGLLDTSIIKSKSGPWHNIAKLRDDLQLREIDLPSLFKIKIGNGEIAKFWLDKWLGGPSLSETFPRLYRLEVSKDVRVVNRSPRYSPFPAIVPTPVIQEPWHTAGVRPNLFNENSPTNPSPNVIGPSGTYRLHFSWAWRRTPRYEEEIQELEALNNLVSQLHLTNSRDSWEFTPCASRKFSVKAFRNIYTSSTTTMTQDQTRWNKCIPIKININSWRVANERLPTRVNLDRRGIDLHSVRCPVCDDDLETENHIFVHCATAKQIWTDILKW